MNMIACDIQPIQNLRVLRKCMQGLSEDEAKAVKIQWGERVTKAKLLARY